MGIFEWITLGWLIALTISLWVHAEHTFEAHEIACYKNERKLSEQEKRQFWYELKDYERHAIAKKAMEGNYNREEVKDK